MNPKIKHFAFGRDFLSKNNPNKAESAQDEILSEPSEVRTAGIKFVS